MMVITASQVTAQPDQMCVFEKQNSGRNTLNFTVIRARQSEGVFNTYYSVSDPYHPDYLPVKTISITNNKNNRNIEIVVMNVAEHKRDLRYIRNYSGTSGLIITPNADKAEEISPPYSGSYILSFQDESKTYINLHYISKKDDYSISFDRISDALMQKNRHVLYQLSLFEQLLALQGGQNPSEEKNLPINTPGDPVATAATSDVTGNTSFLTEIDNFYQKYFSDSMEVVRIDSTINSEIKKRFGNINKVLNGDGEAYQGEFRSGAKEGEGMFIVGHKEAYLGTFKSDKFVSGTVSLKYRDGKKYSGNYLDKHPAGLGRMLYPNGETELGIFAKGSFDSGIIRKKDSSGNSYFGQTLNNRKNGFGFFLSAKGDVFIGNFKDDKPASGYLSQQDNLGLKTIYLIKDGIKNPATSSDWDNMMAEIEKQQRGIK